MVFADASISPNGSIVTWLWDFGEMSSGAFNFSNLQSPSHTYLSAQKFNVTFTVIDDFGCSNDMTEGVEVYSNPVAGFNASNVCFNEIAYFNDNSTPLNSVINWEWDFGDGNGGLGQTTSHLYLDSNTFDVMLIIIDSNTCKDTIIKPITIYPLPVVDFIADTLNGCIPLSVNFEKNTMNSIFWAWDYGDGNTSQGPTGANIYENAGLYTITLTARSKDDCENSLTNNNMIEAYELPIADFSINPTVSTILSPDYNFYNLSFSSVQWQWDFGDNYTSNIENPYHTYNDTGRYTIQLIVYSEYLCSDTIEKSLYVEPDFTLYMPNAFTPNGDLENDEFGPIGIFDGIKEYQYYIFNRWGELVFESNDFNEKWNGKKYNDQNYDYSPDGAYIWYINVRDYMERKYQYKGSVILLK
jgi:gliding motility-associated-like protein